jgi:hypothetical protein
VWVGRKKGPIFGESGATEQEEESLSLSLDHGIQRHGVGDRQERRTSFVFSQQPLTLSHNDVCILCYLQKPQQQTPY